MTGLDPRGTNALVGQVLQDTYRIDQMIGKGGMGVVYGASHVRLTRRYAVKLLNPGAVASDEALERFQREAEITSGLGHPHILEVYDFNTTPDGVPYIVMELLEGEPLSARIARQGRLAFRQVLSIFGQAASALHAVHKKGIIHRDLKPENIFLCQREERDDFVKVVDFGISKVLGLHSSLTGTHALLGSPYYMAPEQAEQRSADVDERTDVYGMGVIVYTMLSGHAPFGADSLPALLYNIVHKPPPSLRTTHPDIPEPVEDAVMVALRKQPSARYQSIQEFWQAFNQAVTAEGMGATVAPIGTLSRPGDLGQPQPPPPQQQQQQPQLAPQPTGELGRNIGNYQLKHKLGEGGMGEVYLAEHPEIGRQVAVKILAAHLLQYPMAAERFVTEARAVTRVKHPNIIDIYDFGRLDDGRLYYIMELLDGQELRQVMGEKGQFSATEVLPYLEQICGALEAAHVQGIIHRDLKPENIYQLDRQPLCLKLLDFGIAKLLEPDGSGKGSRTATGMVMGSPLTMAPEQAAGMPEKIGPHTDLYSLGVVLYWMLAGLPPFNAEASGLLLAKHITERPPPLLEVEPTVPPAVAEVVDRCLEKDPADRPESAAALLEAFRAAVAAPLPAGLPSPASLTGKPPAPATSPTTMRAAAAEMVSADELPRSGRLKWIGLAAGLLVVAGVVAFLALRPGTPDASQQSAAAKPAATEPEPPSTPKPTPPEQPEPDKPEPVAAKQPEPAAAKPEPAAAKQPEPAPVKKPAAARRAKVRITLKVSPADARVLLDGKPLQRRSVELPRSDRSRRLRVEAPGHEPQERSFVARADQTLSVTLRARPQPKPAVAHKAPPKPKPKPKPAAKKKKRLPFGELDDGKKKKKLRFDNL